MGNEATNRGRQFRPNDRVRSVLSRSRLWRWLWSLQWWQMSILVWGVSGIVGSASVWIGVIVSGSPPLAYEQAADVTWGWLVAGAGLVVLMMIVTLLVFSVNWRARKKT